MDVIIKMVGGVSALDYLIKVKEVDFVEAVEIITGRIADYKLIMGALPRGFSMKVPTITMLFLSAEMRTASPNMPPVAAP